MGSFLQKIVSWFKALLGIDAAEHSSSNVIQSSHQRERDSDALHYSSPRVQEPKSQGGSQTATIERSQPNVPFNLRQLLYKSFYSLDRGSDWIDIAHLGNVLRQQDTSFTPQAYGFANLSELLEAASDLVKFERANHQARLNNPPDTRKLLLKAFKQVSEQGDWIHLASFGAAVNQLNKSFSASKYGYSKFRDFVAEHSDLIELKRETSTNAPVDYIRLIQRKTPLSQPSRPTQSIRQSQVAKPTQPVKPVRTITNLFDYAFIPYLEGKYERLADLALPEPWYFGAAPPSNFAYPILKNYLEYTFIRLQHEDKVAVSADGTYSAFNTGLLDRKYDPIHALFGLDKQRHDQRWYLIDFCVSGQNREGRTLASNFQPLPRSANYFTDPEEMFYDIHAGLPQVNWLHVIEGRPDRLPLAFLQTYCPRGFEPRDVRDLSRPEVETYRQQFKRAINTDPLAFRAIKERCESALRLALLQTQLNYRTAIPYYNPRKNRLQLLLPLALITGDTVDCALVVDRTPPDKQYNGYTILPLSWAYTNARQIIRLEAPWLHASLMAHATEADESDDDSGEE